MKVSLANSSSPAQTAAPKEDATSSTPVTSPFGVVLSPELLRFRQDRSAQLRAWRPALSSSLIKMPDNPQPLESGAQILHTIADQLASPGTDAASSKAANDFATQLRMQGDRLGKAAKTPGAISSLSSFGLSSNIYPIGDPDVLKGLLARNVGLNTEPRLGSALNPAWITALNPTPQPGMLIGSQRPAKESLTERLAAATGSPLSAQRLPKKSDIGWALVGDGAWIGGRLEKREGQAEIQGPFMEWLDLAPYLGPVAEVGVDGFGLLQKGLYLREHFDELRAGNRKAQGIALQFVGLGIAIIVPLSSLIGAHLGLWDKILPVVGAGFNVAGSAWARELPGSGDVLKVLGVPDDLAGEIQSTMIQTGLRSKLAQNPIFSDGLGRVYTAA